MGELFLHHITCPLYDKYEHNINLNKNHINLNTDLSYIANNFDNSGHIIVIAKKDNSLGWNYVLM